MNNIEILHHAGMLGAIRQRLGAKHELDESFDAQINKMDTMGLMKAWCGWHLGDPSWAGIIIGHYEGIKKDRGE
jgi:hypothetical protein